MDQRDQAVSGMNQLVGITTYEQGDKLNISLASGGRRCCRARPFIRSRPFPRPGHQPHRGGLHAASRLRRQDSRSSWAIPKSPAASGGLLQFRASSLDVMQSQLGQMAVGLALSFNEQHKLGLDQNGNPGGDYFSIGQPQGVPNAQNKQCPDFGHLRHGGQHQCQDYDITFDGTNYMVTRLPRARRSITVRPRARRRPPRWTWTPRWACA